MKFINILIILVPFFLFGQNKKNIDGVAFYSKQIIQSNSIANQDNESKKQLSLEISKSTKNIEKLSYKLIFNDSIGKYYLENTMSIEIDNSFDMRLAKIFSGFLADVAYYDLKNSKVLLEKSFLGEKMLIKSKIDASSWTLTKEKKIINDILCLKATKTIRKSGKNIDKEIPVIAWYAPSINVNFGPDGYAGLPGLIVQLQVDNVITYISKLDITNENVKINLPKKMTTLSQEEYDDLLKDFNENRSKYYSNRKKQ